jgi:hypothetical protein
MVGAEETARAAKDIIGAGKYDEKDILYALRLRGDMFSVKRKERRSAWR